MEKLRQWWNSVIGKNGNKFIFQTTHGPLLMRQFLAELLGTFLLILFGDGAIAQVIIGQKAGSDSFYSNFQSISFGYGYALAIGILVSGGVSGGHLNPAVSLAMATINKCNWVQALFYMVAQYIGAFLASAVLYGIYYEGLDLVEDFGERTEKTRGIFATYPNEVFNPSLLTTSFDQILGSALLVIIILAVIDKRNMGMASGFVPLFIGLGLAAIHNSFGLNAGCSINPARDFSPRLLTLLAGYDNPFKAANYFFWVPWILPHVGGIVGAMLYELMIEIYHPPDYY